MTQNDIVDEISRICAICRDKFMANEYQAFTTEQKCYMRTVSFLWGHQLEIINTLQTWTKHDTKKYEKFPAFLLLTDIPIVLNEYGEFHGTTLQIIIAMATNPVSDAPTRNLATFAPILRPLLKYFLKELESSNIFQVNSISDYKANIWERFYWGRKGLYGNTGNQLNDYVDAIQIENLKLKLCEDFC